MASWSTLSNEDQRVFARNLIERRRAYELWNYQGVIDETKDILLIADRPGPGAPKDDKYHHTPFYAKTHSGGWLNAELVLAGINENRLFWENSADRHGKARDPRILTVHPWLQIFALGNNAANWLKRNTSQSFTQVLHPQAHKRFHFSEQYALITTLKRVLT